MDERKFVTFKQNIMEKQFNAEEAAKIAEENKLPYLLKKIELQANLGRRRIQYYENISSDMASELQKLGFKVNDIAIDNYEIIW